MEHKHKKKRKRNEEMISEIRKRVLPEKGERKEQSRIKTLRKASLSVKRSLMSTRDYGMSCNV
jgi:Mg2+ and Co2+ transporter CorA